MRRLSFLVNRGEADCFMVHGLEWAAYAEGGSWAETAGRIRENVARTFGGAEKPDLLVFHFPDGRVVSLSA
ncbi:MAG: hypothetical protein LBU64_04200 [Planctomycetota bacterium]|jgi:hypothetical protein|nr:hypothetical protein [Planctomycetota bacterium]